MHLPDTQAIKESLRFIFFGTTTTLSGSMSAPSLPSACLRCQKKKNVPHYLNKTNCSLLFLLYYVFRLSSSSVFVFLHGSTAIRYAVCSPFRLKLRIDKLLGMQIQMVYGVAQLMMQLPMAFPIHFCLFAWGRVLSTTFNESD